MEMEAGNEESLRTEKSVVTGDDDSRQFFGPELLGMGLQPAETAASEWTDEKHSMYLSFIEASFVNQLYSHEYSSADSLGCVPVRQEELLSHNFAQSNPDNHLSSDQFKVLRSGCWQKLNFERGQTRLDCGTESHNLLKNPWIRHFRHLSSVQQPEIMMPNLQVDDISVRHHSRKSMSPQLDITELHPSIYSQISVDQNTEVSDQNFVEGSCSCMEDQLTSSCRRKRVVPSMDSAPRDDITSQIQESIISERRQL